PRDGGERDPPHRAGGAVTRETLLAREPAPPAVGEPSPGEPGPGAGWSRTRRFLARPELGAIGGVVLVWTIFAIFAGEPFRSLEGTAAVLNAAAPLGILAVAVALLMIAGEFDLSVGSMSGLAGMSIM